MSFRDNLQYLRTKRHMTQEQLAMLLGVSRQSISKWESEKAYPEMDKLLTICDLFGCTLDDLVLGDVSLAVSQSSESLPTDVSHMQAPIETDSGTAKPHPGISGTTGDSSEKPRPDIYDSNALPADVPVPPSSPGIDMTGYDDHFRSFALSMALGVASMILGLAAASLFDDPDSIIGTNPFNDLWAFTLLGLGVVIGLALIIPSAMAHTDFKRRHPYVEDFYTDDDRVRVSRRMAGYLVGGIAFVFIGIVVSENLSLVRSVKAWSSGAFFFFVAGAVAFFIYSSIHLSALKVNRYNERMEKRLGRHRFGMRHHRWDDRSDRLSSVVTDVIMGIATIVAFFLLFVSHNRICDVTFPFWLPWVIGGLLCGIVSSIISIYDKNRKD